MKPNYWDDAVAHLRRRDRVMKDLIGRFADMHLVPRGDPFTTLARAIVGQQISVKAAQSIWDRFTHAAAAQRDTGALAVCLDPARVGRMRIPTLRRVGLSERKAEYLRDLARHFSTGALDPTAWPALPDEEVIEALIAVKGIGRWTAEMFLMFHELRADVWPVADIGLQNAVAMHFHDGNRLSLAELRTFGDRFSPYRSVATWYLWRALDPIPVQY